MTPYGNTKFQGEPLHRGHLIHGGGKNRQFSMDFAVYLETVRDRPMVTMER